MRVQCECLNCKYMIINAIKKKKSAKCVILLFYLYI